MTNKEAIETLKAICGDCRLFPKCAYKKSECFTAIDMAIKALEQPEQKKDGETMLTIEQKKHVDAFEYWVQTNTEGGVSAIPESICKDIIAILRYKGGDDYE